MPMIDRDKSEGEVLDADGAVVGESEEVGSRV